MSGGKRSKCGTPQGGVISPLLANIYMHRYLRHWRRTGQDQALRAFIVNYADDFVILSRGHAAQALAWSRQVLEAIGLTLNETKTCLRNASRESFDFLGYTFGPELSRRNGRPYLAAQPSRKSVTRFKSAISHELRNGNMLPWEKVCEQLNRKIRGWQGYFRYGLRAPAYRAIDNHVHNRVVHFLRRRRKFRKRGQRFIRSEIFGKIGVLSLNLKLRRSTWAST